MKKLAVRIGADLWRSIDWYARAAGLVDSSGRVDVSETVRDLLVRGLVQDRTNEAGYRAGYAAGRSAGYADFQRRLAAASASGRR